MFSANAIKVLEKRYFLKDENGKTMETVESLFRRVASAVASVESLWGASDDEVRAQADRFYDSMINRRFMPNSPTLMNAGKPGGQLSACFVLPVPDSLEGIFETCKNAALIHKTGGGTGFSFSRLRPANDRVASSCGVASGPVSFMTVYDAATEAIRQGGTRRGANMGILRVDHPDIEEFISCKRDTGKLNNFNISVAVTDQFMKAVEADGEIELIHPRTGKRVKSLRARYLFDKIIDNAHATGEPGIIFIDRINRDDPVYQALDEDGNLIAGTEDIEATNPCGEQPLGPGDACNLASINLSLFVDRERCDFDWRSLEREIAQAVRFLDDVIDANHYPLAFIARATLNNRRIGLGVMGWAEALVLLGIPYDSEAAIEKAEELMSFVNEKAHAASAELAQKRGVFPNWPHTRWCAEGIKMRNATVTTIAPTGTISIIAGTTSGIEPVFAVVFVRRVMGGTELLEINPVFEMIGRERGFLTDELFIEIGKRGSLCDVGGIPDDVRRLFVCSHDIASDWHVRMQAAFQKHTDNAVSKTINFPSHASVDDVKEAYLSAWRSALKGITVYRDTSRPLQVLNIKGPMSDEIHEKKESSAALQGTVISPQYESAFSCSPRQLLPQRTERASLAIAVSDCHEDNFSIETVHMLDMRTIAPCPECGYQSGSLAYQESCVLCISCGYTMC